MANIGFRELTSGFRRLGIDQGRPVIAHASFSAFGEVSGGAEAFLGALLSVYNIMIMPTFTYTTMVTPLAGPPDNAITYGSQRDINLMAEFFSPEMPADKLMGVIPELLRRHPKARRSSHPILSFSGVNADATLETQTLEEPLAPIRRLAAQGGWVLLLGVDHTDNTSIHYGERVAGRKQFIRWALTARGIVECPGFPGCSDGFQKIAPYLEGMRRVEQIGDAYVEAVPLVDLVDTVVEMIHADPRALLCDNEDCERCNAIRS